MLHSFEACVNQRRYRSPIGYLSALEVRDYTTEGSAGCNSSVLTSATALYRNGPRELDSVVSEIFLGFQAAKSR